MKNLIVNILLLIVILSCNSKNETLKLLQGKWAESKISNVDFTIKGENIIYFENPQEYKIQLKNDYLIISEEGEQISKYKIISISNEMLKLKTEEGNIIVLFKI